MLNFVSDYGPIGSSRPSESGQRDRERHEDVNPLGLHFLGETLDPNIAQQLDPQYQQRPQIEYQQVPGGWTTPSSNVGNPQQSVAHWHHLMQTSMLEFQRMIIGGAQVR